MHSVIRIFSLMSLLSLILGSLTGCGEKRIHASTVSGTPGEKTAALSPRDESATTETSGLSEASIEEAALSVQDQATDELFDKAALPVKNSAADELPMEAQTSAMTNEPVDMAHASGAPSSQDGLSDSSLADVLMSAQEPDSSVPDTLMSAQEPDSVPDAPMSEQEPDSSVPDALMSAQEPILPGNDDLFDPLEEGQDFNPQSSSSPTKEFQEPTRSQYSDPIPLALSQNSSAGLENALSGEDAEPVLDVLQIAKAEPADSLRNQLNRMKSEALAAAAAGLEDVFFKFDSWRITRDGRQSLQRTLGWFKENPSSTIIIEGHADQRGTEAYNMILAKKRAVAVQDYLSQLGVDTSRLAVISYGKDKPFCSQATEVCYQLNRRGHLLISNR